MKQKIKCPVCGASKKPNIKGYWAMKGYKLYKCQKCSMVWDAFPQDNLLSQYEKSYFVNENPKGGYANYFDGMKINKRTFSTRLKRIEKEMGKKGRLLDVGCALGDCLMEAKNMGWKEAEGLEVSEYAVKLSKEKGLKVKQGVLDKYTFPANTFDVVTYQDVIEHIADPLNELKKVKHILKTDGLLFMVTPDVGGWWHRLLGSLWYHYKPGEHVTYFSQQSLKKLYKLAGFKNIKTKKTYHVLSLEYILNRLKYYQPWFFETLLKFANKFRVKNISFKAYTGEIESWGYK